MAEERCSGRRMVVMLREAFSSFSRIRKIQKMVCAVVLSEDQNLRVCSFLGLLANAQQSPNVYAYNGLRISAKIGKRFLRTDGLKKGPDFSENRKGKGSQTQRESEELT